MKMTTEHYGKLRDAIKLAQADHRPESDYLSAGLSRQRYRWDLLYASTRRGLLSNDFICQDLYKYLNDTHIDTALRRIIG